MKIWQTFNFVTPQWRIPVGIAIVLSSLIMGATLLGLAVHNYTKSTPIQTINTPFAYRKQAVEVPFFENLNTAFWEGGKLLFRDDIPANSKRLLIPLETYAFIESRLTEFQTKSVNVRADGLAKHAAAFFIDIVFDLTGSPGVEKSKLTTRFTVRINWNSAGKPVFTIPSTGFIKGVGKSTNGLFNQLIPKDADLTKYYFSNYLLDPKPDGTDATYAWELNPTTGEFYMYNGLNINKKTLEIQIYKVTHDSWAAL